MVFGKCVPSLREGVDGFGEAGEVYGVLGHVFGDGGVIQCNLRKNAAGDLVEVLEDIADLAAALGIRHEGDVLFADGDRAFFRLVKAQKQLEEGAFADAGAADEGDFLPFFDREGEILKYSRLVFGIAEGDMREEDAAVGATVLGGLTTFFLGEEGIDACDASYGRLDGLLLSRSPFDRCARKISRCARNDYAGGRYFRFTGFFSRPAGYSVSSHFLRFII